MVFGGDVKKRPGGNRTTRARRLLLSCPRLAVMPRELQAWPMAFQLAPAAHVVLGLFRARCALFLRVVVHVVWFCKLAGSANGRQSFSQRYSPRPSGAHETRAAGPEIMKKEKENNQKFSFLTQAFTLYTSLVFSQFPTPHYGFGASQSLPPCRLHTFAILLSPVRPHPTLPLPPLPMAC